MSSSLDDDVLRDRYRGALLGLACGDAVGTTVEFSPRGSFPPVSDMVGGGPFQLAPGAWTDDTSMALCLATSLIQQHGFDARDQMNRYVNGWQWGYLSATGECFDICMTVCKALQRYQVTGDPMAGSNDPRSAGNGSLMRLAPVVLHFHADRRCVLDHARLSSATTHAAPEALDCCALFADLIANALDGVPRDRLLSTTLVDFSSPKPAASTVREPFLRIGWRACTWLTRSVNWRTRCSSNDSLPLIIRPRPSLKPEARRFPESRLHHGAPPWSTMCSVLPWRELQGSPARRLTHHPQVEWRAAPHH